MTIFFLAVATSPARPAVRDLTQDLGAEYKLHLAPKSHAGELFSLRYQHTCDFFFENRPTSPLLHLTAVNGPQ